MLLLLCVVASCGAEPPLSQRPLEAEARYETASGSAAPVTQATAEEMPADETTGRTEQAGLKPVSAPDLRHAAIRDLTRAGVGGLTILSILGQAVDLSPYEDRPEGAARPERKVEGGIPYHRWDDGHFSEERLRVMRALGLWPDLTPGR